MQYSISALIHQCKHSLTEVSLKAWISTENAYAFSEMFALLRKTSYYKQTKK